MEKKVEIIEGVTAEIGGLSLMVKGPKGELFKSFDDPRNSDIKIEKSSSNVVISCQSESRKKKAMVGTIVAHLKNMMKGVTSGYVYEMKIVYKHFPMTIEIKNGEVRIKNFIGERGIRCAKIVGKCQVNAEKDDVILSGINIEEVGQTAANIERACRLKGRDRRIFQDGIYTVKKKR